MSVLTLGSLSDNGDILSVSTDVVEGDGDGKVMVYKYNETNSTWEIWGDQTLLVGENGEEFGSQHRLSGNGQILAVGSAAYDAPTEGTFRNKDQGRVKVFKYNETNKKWEQMGNTIVGDQHNEYFGGNAGLPGQQISLSNNGEILAVGVDSRDVVVGNKNLLDAGQVEIYKYNKQNTTWVAMGDQSLFSGENPFDFTGRSVSLSGNGQIVAIGAPLHEIGGRTRTFKDDDEYENVGEGKVKVFKYSETGVWELMGDILMGMNVDDQFGTTLS